MFEAGHAFDALLDRLQAMGAPAPRWGRVGGQHEIWLNVSLPGRKTVERRGANLDIAARNILDLDLSASDKEQAQALKSP